MRRIIGSFSSSTAVAYDNLAPRVLDELSDDILAEIIAIFDRCEAEGMWPDDRRAATMVMIPKAAAYKWRRIAMLCTLYGIWARAAGEDLT